MSSRPGCAGWATPDPAMKPAAAAPPALAQATPAADPERMKRLSEELRCLVCQNQTLADSNAELAVDLKRQIEVLLKQG